MRMKTILYLLFVGVVAIPLARAGTGGVSSKAAFSKGATATEIATTTAADRDGGIHGRLARITAYWPGEDYYTNHRLSATGVRLRDGYCAVDSSIIPYGSVVKIPELGSYVAVDTGTAVISRRAARLAGHNSQERSALVIDLYFASRRAGELFSRQPPMYAMVAW
jgi:3D (Asp-Asp-Asp) domain-containing protein